MTFSFISGGNDYQVHHIVLTTRVRGAIHIPTTQYFEKLKTLKTHYQITNEKNHFHEYIDTPIA